MYSIILKNATAFCQGSFKQCDIAISDDHISKIDKQITEGAAQELDCSGMLVLPGLIDAHVHFREPGMPKKANIFSESCAAALGGVTSVMDMPNTNPAITTNERVDEQLARAKEHSLVNYACYLGASSDNLEDVKKADPTKIAGIKIYMGSTTGNLLLDDDSSLNKIFAAAPCLIATHCEDNDIIEENLERALQTYGMDNIPFSLHPIIRSRECCIKSSSLAIELAKAHNKRLHIMHLSCKEEVDLLRPFTVTNDIHERLVSGEVCIPHLFFNESNYNSLRGFLKCNPAVKYEADRLALIRALRAGIISTIGTDHAPHERELKEQCYSKAPSGVPSIQFSLNVIFELSRRGEISLEEGIRAASEHVAQRFGIEKRGVIAEGNFADIVVLDTQDSYSVSEDDIASICQWSPFVGSRFSSRVKHTIASGNLVVKDGLIFGAPGKAQALRFKP